MFRYFLEIATFKCYWKARAIVILPPKSLSLLEEVTANKTEYEVIWALLIRLRRALEAYTELEEPCKAAIGVPTRNRQMAASPATVCAEMGRVTTDAKIDPCLTEVKSTLMQSEPENSVTHNKLQDGK